MKKLFFVFLFFLFSLSLIGNENDAKLLTLKYQGVAIGQISLSYRLISLSTSLSIARAVEKDYIFSLLDNVDSTLLNCKKIVSSNNSNPDKLSKNILVSIDFLVNCSKNVKEYAALQSYDNLNKVRDCIDHSSERIDKLTDQFNEASSALKKDTNSK